jgi:hypothetical protein
MGRKLGTDRIAKKQRVTAQRRAAMSKMKGRDRPFVDCDQWEGHDQRQSKSHVAGTLIQTRGISCRGSARSRTTSL